MSIKEDKFVEELIKTLNNIAKDKGSIYQFEIASDIVKVHNKRYYHISLLYNKLESDEKGVFIKQKYQISNKFTEEEIVDTFKQTLLKHIIFLKDYMTEHLQARSMRTLLSGLKTEKKIFNRYDEYLKGEKYYEEELQDESGRYYLREN